MSIYLDWRCQAEGCRKVFRGGQPVDGIRPRCPYCSSDVPAKIFVGDVTRHLPPCSPALRHRPTSVDGSLAQDEVSGHGPTPARDDESTTTQTSGEH